MLSRLLTVKEQFVLIAFAGSILLGALALYITRPSEEAPEALLVAPPVKTAAAPIVPVPKQPAPAAVEAPTSAPAIAPPVVDPPKSALAQIAVSVAGAVRKPGVYRFAEEARVQDAIDEAGGALDSADLNDINLAAKLIDASTLQIPARPEPQEGRNNPFVRRPMTANPPEYTISGWRYAREAAAAAPVAMNAPQATGASKALIDLNHASAAELETLPGIGEGLAGRIIQYRSTQPFQSVDDVSQVSGIGPKRLEAIRPFVTVR